MTIELTKGPTLHDHKLREYMERYPAALQDLREHDHSGAASYLADNLIMVSEFSMSSEVAKHHVYRLHQSCDIDF